jgi:capsular polysaccharide biosynthesis protein
MTEISLDFLFKVFKENWWKIMIFALVVMIIAASITHFLIPKKYSSKIEFYIVNVNTDSDYTSTSLLGAASYLVNDYVAIIKSDYMMDQVIERLKAEGFTEYNGAPLTNEMIRRMISHSSSSQTSAFTLKMTCTDRAFAHKVTSLIAEMAPEIVTKMAKPEDNTNENLAQKILAVVKYLSSKNDITVSEVEAALNITGMGATQLNCIEVLTPPALAKSHDSPSLIMNTLLSGVIAAIVYYAIHFLLALTNMTVVTEDELKKLVKHPIIGTIPRWEIDPLEK